MGGKLALNTRNGSFSDTVSSMHSVQHQNFQRFHKPQGCPIIAEAYQTLMLLVVRKSPKNTKKKNNNKWLLPGNLNR